MQKLRPNLNIISIGVPSGVAEAFTPLLRSARLAPSIQPAETEAALKDLLKERQWEIILYAQQAPLDLSRLGELLKANNKDVPVIVLTTDSSPEQAIAALKKRASAVVPASEAELLVMLIRRELYHLENRRRRRQAEFHLIESEKRCRQLLQNSSEAIAFLNKESQFIFVNPAFQHLTGYDNGTDILGHSITDLVSDDDSNQFTAFINAHQQDPRAERDIELTIYRKDGNQFNGSLLFRKSRFERTPCTEVILHSPDEESQMDSVAEQDLITGLKNQVYLHKRLEQSIRNAVNGSQGAHLLYLTLDNFTAIKTEMGVDGADAIVRDIAQLLQGLVDQPHCLTRHNLDAFGIIYQCEDSDQVNQLAESIRAAVEAHLTPLADAQIRTTCSIGIVPITSNSLNAQEVLESARTASSTVSSQEHGGNGVSHCTPEEAEQGLSVNEVRQAIQSNHLKLLFQPMVSLRGEHENIYEVLLRLIDDSGTEVSPSMFLAMLDHPEVGAELDRWVIGESIRQLATEHGRGNNNRLFINITGRSLEDPGLLQWVNEQLKASGVPGNSLVFQFSESDAANYMKFANIFAQSLLQLHASACIKHYGSSIDSENVLRRVPAQYVKLDGAFVQELQDQDKHEAFDKLIEPLRREGKTLVAPLVEGTHVMSKLWTSGIHYVQGYYLQAPRARMDYVFFDEG